VIALTLVPALARAQLGMYRADNRATGERYNVEFSLGLWNPTPAITIASTSLVAIGSQIDAVNDLGFTTSKLTDFHLVLRPAKKHKILFEYLPIKYSADATLTRTIVFHGVTYTLGLPVTSSLDWKAYRFAYEYDLVYRSRGFVGIIGGIQYADIRASVASPLPGASAFTQQRAPIPALGGIARAYLAENVSITGEVTGFKLPSNLFADTNGRSVDFDLYGTLNFSDNFGAQGGYRWIDLNYQVTNDSGTVKLKGLYLRGVVRF
jgi:hypothetical protein